MRGVFRYILVLFALVVCAQQVKAQTLSEYMTQRNNARGILFNRDLVTIADMCNLSQSNLGYGTARSSALSGAISSLGGDATSMLINPAGLGMYSSTELSFSPTYIGGKSSVAGAMQSGDQNTNKMAIGNMSIVMKIYESGTTKLTALNFGVAYTRTADYNQKYTVQSMGQSSSVANLFSRQLTESQTSLNSLFGSNNPDWSYMPSNMWGAALGYKAGLTFQNYGDTPSDYYDTSADGSEAQNYRDPITQSDEIVWNSTWIDPNGTVDQQMSYVSSGSAGEYDISIGGNIDNKLYFGATLGVLSMHQRIDIYYNEVYNSSSTFDSQYKLNYSNYNQAIVMSGTGINFKMGVTYRLKNLRVAAAYHTPTSYSISRQYQVSVNGNSTFYGSDGTATTYNIAEDSPLLEDTESNSWTMSTPAKLIVGGSYIFDMRALISFDYQIDFYKQMKMKSTPTGVSTTIYSGISDMVNNLHTCRIGAEYKFSPLVTLRGGYSFTSDLVDSSSASFWDIPVDNSVSSFSAGIGFMLSLNSYLDLSFVRQVTTQTGYSMFWSDGNLTSLAPSLESSRSVTLSNKIRECWATVTLRFNI